MPQSPGVNRSVVLSDALCAELRRTLAGFYYHSQTRGVQYMRRGAVLELRRLGDGTGFEAEVQGSRLYTVTWTRDGGRWKTACSCPLGRQCKHAYAAALAALQDETPPPLPRFPGAPPPPVASPAASPEVRELAARLEHCHGRPLVKKEWAFLCDLESEWRRLRSICSLYEHDLQPFGIDPQRRSYYNFNSNSIISDWWDAAHPVASPLEFWQFLALYAERNGLPIPELMRPVTDTASARAQVEERERGRVVANWHRLFEERSPEPPEPHAAAAVPAEVRVRLGYPKMTWEARAGAGEAWHAVKGGQVREWFQTAANHPAGVPPVTLALLQEVQLRRTRGNYWGSTEPQTLKLDDPATLQLVHWLVVQPAMRHLLVNAAGESFDPEPVRLQWSGHPLPDRADDIVFDLIQPDGAPAPTDLLELPGDPSLALAGRAVFALPPALPGSQSTRLVVPREALLTPAAARRLSQAGARLEGVELPVVQILRMQPRFVCRLRDDQYSPPGSLDRLDVVAQAFAPEGGLVQQWNGVAWTTLEGSAAPARTTDSAQIVFDYDHAAANAARGLLGGLKVIWASAYRVWIRRMIGQGFGEEFAAWADQVRAAGVELDCDPSLAGLARPPDRARLEVLAVPVGEGAAAIDWFDLQVVVRAEDAALTDAEIRLLLKARGRFVRLPGKGWRRLQLELGAEETERLAELGIDPAAMDGPTERQRFHALQLADDRIAGLLPEAHAAQVRERAGQLRAVALPPMPGGLLAELRPYQREGFHFLVHLAANRLGGVLADDMGLGKTVQTLAWLLHLQDTRSAKSDSESLRVLVVCPKSVVPNWERETRRFAPALTTAPLRSQTELPTGAHLIVANYAQLRRAAAALGAVTWDAVILDEAQNIKNPQSLTARIARELRASHRLVLTGTPIENRMLDLWSLFAFAMPGLLGSQAAFKRAFNDKTDPRGRTRLARRVRHFMLRRTKAQVAAELPPRLEEDQVIELEGTQRKLYDAELKRARAMLLGVTTSREFDRQRFNILQSLLRLRQICCDPRLVGLEPPVAQGKVRPPVPTRRHGRVPPAESGASAAAGARASASSAKLEALLETLESVVEEGHRVLVFSQFVSMLELISGELSARGIGHLMLTGQTEKRQALVDRFQSPEGEPVFLLSLKSAGTGLNLTAASYVVLYDPWWNPAVEAQAIDRTHRIGQKEQVIAYRLLARNTIEEKIRKLQQAKAELARAIVQEETVATVMSLEDLRFVLGE